MKVYEFFMESCRVAGLSLSIKELQDKNPAGNTEVVALFKGHTKANGETLTNMMQFKFN